MTPPAVQPCNVAAGYAQPWVVAPGQAVALHASLPQATQVDIVRLACVHNELQPDGQPHGAAERIEPVPEGTAGVYGPAVQALVPGAQLGAACMGLPAWPDCVLVLALQRSARGAPGHVLSLRSANDAGLRIELVARAGTKVDVAISLAPGGETLQLALPPNEWLLLVLDFVPATAWPGAWQMRARTALCRAAVPNGVPAAWSEHHLPVATLPKLVPASLQLGTRLGDMASADLRLDLVSVLPAACLQAPLPADLLAAGGDDALPTLSPWETTALREPISACLLRGRVGKAHSAQDLAGRATLIEPQRPYSAVRGIRWDGRFQSPLQAPAHYTALHLNSDTLLDAHWAPTLSWRVPSDLASGSYAFRLRDPAQPDQAASYASFFVSAASRPQHPVAVLLPTFTYLAYANAPEDMRGERVTETPHLAEQRLDALHPAHGRSIYERHRDGQGVLWASSRRPLWSVSPGHRPWGLAADSCLLDWLDQQGQAYDVITDHDLHRLGAAALQPYRVVLTGHHPEYTSTAMWDGLWCYLQEGGRLLYLGGNGFYWRTACDESAEAIEVRRAEDGTRPSIAPPGEYHCAFSGEYGGLWRRLGRPPQQIVGLGMSAQGFEHAAHYRKCADAHAPEVAFVFGGVDANTFGHSGWWGGGASGWEIDRCDAELGTPPQTHWLARSEGHAASMLRTKEELLSYVTPFEDTKARSDVVLAPLGKGDVFAVGSMTWIGSLHGTGQATTDVATITANVIRRFLDPTPLPRKPDHE